MINNKIIERINKNEEIYNNLKKIIDSLSNNTEIFKYNIKDLIKLKKYYESKTWLKDKDYYENNKEIEVKAGILSEDTLWDFFEETDQIINIMKLIIKEYEK